MIKYLGSKRTLVGVLGELTEAVGARTAVDLFTGTTRVAQELKRRGIHVTAADLATYSEVFGQCYVATDAATVDLAEVEDGAGAAAERCRPVRGYVTRTFCEDARYFQPHNGMLGSTRSATASRSYAGSAAVPDPADQPGRGRRPGGLHDRPADGVPARVGAALGAAAASCACPSCWPGPGRRCAAMPSSSSTSSNRWT